MDTIRCNKNAIRNIWHSFLIAGRIIRQTFKSLIRVLNCTPKSLVTISSHNFSYIRIFTHPFLNQEGKISSFEKFILVLLALFIVAMMIFGGVKHVEAFPDAAFNVDTSKGALPLLVQFTDFSIGIITEWLWDFGDGYRSTKKNPIHTYTEEGTYTVSLTVSNPDGSDTETKADYIQVISVPPGDFLPEKLTYWIGHPDIAADATGNIFVVSEYFDYYGGPFSEDGLLFIMKPQGESWSVPEIIYNGSCENHQIATDGTGTVHTIWRPFNSKILYSARNSDGSWTTPIELSPVNSFTPDIAVDGNNTLHVVWQHNFVTDIVQHWDIFYTSKPDGEDWTTHVNISNATKECCDPKISVSDTGLVHVIWCEGSPPDIQYACKNSDSSWSEPVTLSIEVPGSPVGGAPRIAAGNDGIMHAIWNQGGTTYSKKPEDGEWSDPISIPNVGGHAEIAIDSNGTIHVIGISGATLYHTNSAEGTDWSTPVRISPEDGMFVSDMSLSMATDNIGNLHVSHFRIVDYGIWYLALGQVPPVDFTATPISGTVPLEVQFTDQSSGNPIGWLWDFGYGQTSTEKNPIHIYDNPGIYTVKLTVSIPPSTNRITKTDYIAVYENAPASLSSFGVKPLSVHIPQSGARFGRSIASVGDINKDGTTDFLVGALGLNLGGNPGAAILFSGATRKPLLNLDNPNPQVNSSFGKSVALAGDINQDGTPDLLIGAPSQDVGGNVDQGQAFVFNGATGELLLTLENPNPTPDSCFGESLTSAGDINGDSIPDLLIGCGCGRGKAFVFDGITGDVLLTLEDPDTEDSYYFGTSVSTAGDVNGDDTPDLLVGCPRDGSRGQAFVFSGVTGEILLALKNPGHQAKSGFAECVSPAGDINGDGTPDLLIGALDLGQAFVFSGATGGLFMTLTLPGFKTSPFYTIMALSPLGDMNGDGIHDLFIGFTGLGQAFVFSGATGGILLTLNNPEPQIDDYFGCAVDSADIDNDGIQDLLIGAYEQDADGQTNQGQVFMFLSKLTADFSIEPVEVKVMEEVRFTDLTQAGFPPYTYEWDFDSDGTIDSAEKDPTWQYDRLGVYIVSLRVTDSKDNTDTMVKEINILDLDIFGLETGNALTYQGTSNGSSYTLEQEVVSLDQTTFPTTTYVIENRTNGILDAKGWYEKTPGELRFWGVRGIDGGDLYNFYFSAGLIEDWHPMNVGEHRESFANMIGVPGISVSMTVDVLDKEPISLSFDTLEAYRLYYEMTWWVDGVGQTNTFEQWVVPFLGTVKSQDAESLEVLTSFAIDGGTITQETDADGDGLKDYQELIVFNTDLYDADTDVDGMPDGWEVTYGLNPLFDDAGDDLDGDGVCNVDEYSTGRNPLNWEPDKPFLYLPLNGDIDVSLTPELQTGSFSDTDGDIHAETVWQISCVNGDFSDAALVFDVKSDSHLTLMTVPEFVLNTNTLYYWRVKFHDDRGASSEWSDPYSFKTITTDETDSNEDGIPDDQEVDETLDMDVNGIPDIDQNDILCVNTVVGGGQICVKISTNCTCIESIKSINPDTITNTENKPEETPLGLINFKLRVDNVGDTAETTVYFCEAAPIDAKWYKYDSIKGWQDFSAHATFSADRMSVTLELKDGDYGDADGTANGIIVDPSGLVTLMAHTPDNGMSSGGCFIDTAASGSLMKSYNK